MHRRLRAAGCEPAGVEISAYWFPRDQATVARAVEAGVARVIFVLDPLVEDAALKDLDRLKALMDRCEGE